MTGIMPNPSAIRTHLTSREFKAEDTLIQVGPVQIGGPELVVIAGPCAVESREQIFECARLARESNVHILRGGCYKPRTSPYSFQGLGHEALLLLAEAGRQYGLPVITEVPAPEEVDLIAEHSDLLQIGSRNMQNFSLLRAVGRTRRPVLLKRGMTATLDELLLAAEYIMLEGNHQVILCERGIRTFETATRNTLDISAVPVLKSLTHLPVVVDPSHAAGRRDLVPALSRCAQAVGAHGIMIEFHPSPEQALSDGEQSLQVEQLRLLMDSLKTGAEKAVPAFV